MAQYVTDDRVAALYVRREEAVRQGNVSLQMEIDRMIQAMTR